MNRDNLYPIPGSDHYASTYLGANFDRLFSYQMQVSKAIRGLKPSRVLLVGVGDGIVADVLRRASIEVVTLDISAELKPDLVASIEDIPLDDLSVDVAVCCQVLEHLPFEKVGRAIEELGRVTRHRVVISVPDQRRYVGLRFSILGRKRSLAWSPPHLWPPKFDASRHEIMGHYWEVGFQEYPFKLVRDRFRLEGWSGPVTQRVPDLPWHLFIELNREDASKASRRKP